MSSAGGLCRFSGAFGEPNEGAHSLRLGGLAAVDLFATLALSWATTRCAFGRVDLATLAIVFIIYLIGSVFVHRAFCVNTRLTAAVLGRPWPGAWNPGAGAA